MKKVTINFVIIACSFAMLLSSNQVKAENTVNSKKYNTVTPICVDFPEICKGKSL